jgi:hypothetical protein
VGDVTTFIDVFASAESDESGEALCGSWQEAKVAVIQTHFVRTTYPVMKYQRAIVSATKEEEVKTAVRRARRLWQAART